MDTLEVTAQNLDPLDLPSERAGHGPSWQMGRVSKGMRAGPGSVGARECGSLGPFCLMERRSRIPEGVT